MPISARWGALGTALCLTISACGSADSTLVRSSVSPADVGAGEAAVVTETQESVGTMAVGDILQREFDGRELLRIDLSDGAPDAEYMLAVLNLNERGASSTVYLNSLSAPHGESHVGAKSVVHDNLQERFDAQLRAHEHESAQRAPVALSKSAAVAAPIPEVGHVDNFSVISSVHSLSSTTTVEAELYCVGDHILYYVDTEVERTTPQDFTREDVREICTAFDAQAGDMTEVLGATSDVDGNKRVIVLSTPQVNRLGSLGGGVITGFFFSSDLHGGNYQEILYTLVPDSAAQYGLAVPRAIALENLIPAVLPHELQHAINYNQHVLAGDGSPEESWLNEAISHLAEDHWGVGFENPSRYALYLNQPQYHSLITSGSPGLLSRGGMYLLARYLYEQVGGRDAFMQSLVRGEDTGVANLEAAVASNDPTFDEFSEFMMRWSAALALNDLGITQDSRYQYAPRTWGDESGYAGVCTYCFVDDQRGTVVSGVTTTPYSSARSVSSNPSTVAYYTVSASQQEIELWGVGDGKYGAVLMRVD